MGDLQNVERNWKYCLDTRSQWSRL